jgi:hypothetical protein
MQNLNLELNMLSIVRYWLDINKNYAECENFVDKTIYGFMESRD